MSVDVRVIAATNRDLEKAIGEGKFREDLYYRLNVFPIRVPALREHPEEILTLTRAFIKEFGDAMAKLIDTVPRNAIEAMQSYPWPGNVRELRNVIERAMITSTGGTLKVNLQEAAASTKPNDLIIQELERKHILNVLEKTNWRIKGEKGVHGSRGDGAEVDKIRSAHFLRRASGLGVLSTTKNSVRRSQLWPFKGRT